MRDKTLVVENHHIGAQPGLEHVLMFSVPTEFVIAADYDFDVVLQGREKFCKRFVLFRRALIGKVTAVYEDVSLLWDAVSVRLAVSVRHVNDSYRGR